MNFEKEFKIVKSWTTKEGYPAVIIKVHLNIDEEHKNLGINSEWYNGYVGIAENHEFYNKGYRSHTNIKLKDFLSNNPSIGGRGAITIFGISYKNQDDYMTIEELIDVHGSITYMNTSNEYPISTEKKYTWLGFDCNHYDDNMEKCNLEYVEKQCNKLSEQLKKYETI